MSFDRRRRHWKDRKKAPFFLLISLPLPIPNILGSAHWNEPSVYLSGKPKEVISVVLFAVKVCVCAWGTRPSENNCKHEVFFLLKIISASSPTRGRKWTIMLVKLCVSDTTEISLKNIILWSTFYSFKSINNTARSWKIKRRPRRIL